MKRVALSWSSDNFNWHWLILPFLHVCLCAAIMLGMVAEEGSWRWFSVFWVDFPFSVMLLPILKVANPAVIFTLLGTLWWFGINVIGLSIIRRSGRRWKRAPAP